MDSCHKQAESLEHGIVLSGMPHICYPSRPDNHTLKSQMRPLRRYGPQSLLIDGSTEAGEANIQDQPEPLRS